MVRRTVRPALLAVCTTLASLGHAAPPLGWQAVSEYPASTMPGIGLASFAGKLDERTGGALTLSVRYDDPLDARAALEAARAGRIEVGDVHAGPLGAAEPIFGLVTLPFIATSMADTRCLQAVTRADYSRRFEALGVHLLYSAPWPATGLWSATPVATLDDLRRLKVRTYDATSAAFLASLGTTAVHLPMARAMPLIADGTYTGVMSSGDGGAGQRLWQYLRHFAALAYSAPLSFAVLNKAAYDGLPAELRSQVDEAARETETQLWTVMQDREDRNRQAMREHEVETSEVSDPALAEALHAASAHAIDAWLARAGPDGAALLARYRSALCARTR
ncbi:TRAP transporter substrate-binding protein DctP [Burkholderia plantarii]|nr:TRAP transporter substrate-binding protein DctP [Burkholderia plantarii]